MAKLVKKTISNAEIGKVIYFLKTMGDNEDTANKIATNLKRPIKTIKKIIAEIRTVFTGEEEVKYFVKLPILRRVLASLMHSGITKQSADSKIKKVLSTLSENEQRNIVESTLFQQCLQLTNAGDLLINTSDSGNKNVAVMTPASSERGDNFLKDAPPDNPAIFRIFKE